MLCLLVWLFVVLGLFTVSVGWGWVPVGGLVFSYCLIILVYGVCVALCLGWYV